MVRPAPARQPHRLVHRRGDRRLEGLAKDNPRRAAALLAPAIATALTLRAVFRLALRRTEGLVGSILALLGLDLAVPDRSTLSRRAETLVVALPRRGSGPVHMLVDSTGLKLCGSGEWLLEKHGTRTRRS